MYFVEYSYGVYLLVSVVVTVWVARTLFKNGRIFLIDACHGNQPLADSINHLLVVGFYLVNIGYVSLMLKAGDKPESLKAAIEFLSMKIGWVLLILGAMHFFNIAIFSRMRRRGVDAMEAKAAVAQMQASRRLPNDAVEAMRVAREVTTPTTTA